jgi:hypothetical protein
MTDENTAYSTDFRKSRGISSSQKRIEVRDRQGGDTRVFVGPVGPWLFYNTGLRSDPLKSWDDCYGNKPKTATLVGVPTYTRPFATIGVMNLLSAKWSRALLA